MIFETNPADMPRYLAKCEAEIGRCQTTERGRKCDNDATYMVQGTVIACHATCAMHMAIWRSLGPDNLVEWWPLVAKPNNRKEASHER